MNSISYGKRLNFCRPKYVQIREKITLRADCLPALKALQQKRQKYASSCCNIQL